MKYKTKQTGRYLFDMRLGFLEQGATMMNGQRVLPLLQLSYTQYPRSGGGFTTKVIVGLDSNSEFSKTPLVYHHSGSVYKVCTPKNLGQLLKGNRGVYQVMRGSTGLLEITCHYNKKGQVEDIISVIFMPIKMLRDMSVIDSISLTKDMREPLVLALDIVAQEKLPFNKYHFVIQKRVERAVLTGLDLRSRARFISTYAELIRKEG